MKNKQGLFQAFWHDCRDNELIGLSLKFFCLLQKSAPAWRNRPQSKAKKCSCPSCSYSPANQCVSNGSGRSFAASLLVYIFTVRGLVSLLFHLKTFLIFPFPHLDFDLPSLFFLGTGKFSHHFFFLLPILAHRWPFTCVAPLLKYLLPFSFPWGEMKSVLSQWEAALLFYVWMWRFPKACTSHVLGGGGAGGPVIELMLELPSELKENCTHACSPGLKLRTQQKKIRTGCWFTQNTSTLWKFQFKRKIGFKSLCCLFALFFFGFGKIFIFNFTKQDTQNCSDTTRKDKKKKKGKQNLDMWV